MPIPSGGLVAKFNFGDPACFTDGGTSVLDLVGNNDLTFTNTNYTYNSTNGTITIQDTNEASTATVGTFPSGTGAYTVVVWAKTGTAFKRLFGFVGGGTNEEMLLCLDGSNLLYAANNNSSEVSTSGFAANEWHMFAVTKAAAANSSAQLLYVDGVLVASSHSGTDGQVNLTYASAPKIGYNLGDPGFAEVSVGTAYVYNQVLSAGNILDIYNNDKADYPFISYDFSNTLSYPGTGNTVFDLAGSLNLPIVNATFAGSGQSKYFDFNGSNAYIGKTGVTGVGSTFTISFWAQQNTSNPQVPFSCGYVSGAGRGVQFTFSGTISYDLSASFNNGIGYVNSLSTHSPNTWEMYTYTCDGTTSKLYINGVIQGSDTQDSAFWDTGSFSIGANTNSSGNITTGGDSLNGKIALLDVYNVALGSTDITTIYNDTETRFFPPITPVASYDFSDPLCYPGSGSTVFDLSGSLDLPISGATYAGTGQSKYFNFDGSSYIGAKNLNLLPSDNTFSMNMWAKKDAIASGGTAFLLSIGANPGASGTNPYITANEFTEKYSVQFSNGIGAVNSTSEIPNSVWSMITYTADGTNSKIYIDGVLDGTASQGIGSNPASNATLYLGAVTDGSNNPLVTNRFTGDIAIVEIYDTALSAGDITTIYNDTETRFGTPPPTPPSNVGGRQFAQGFNG